MFTRMNPSARCFPTLALVSLLGLGCGSEPPPAPSDAATPDVLSADATLDGPARDAAPDAGFSCKSIGGLCHEVDPGDGPIHECHEEGHAAEPMWCAANAERCRMLCEAAHRARDAGVDASGDGAQGDAGATDASATSVACRLLGSYCHSVDPGSGPIHDCHDGAHAGDPAWCSTNAVRCYTLCRAAIAAAADAGADAASDAATAHEGH